MRRYILLAGAVALTVALSVGVATATAGRGKGNSANAHLCQKGGWMKLQRSDGTRFANQGACVSYGAHGGTVAPIAPTVSISFSPTSSPSFCNVTVNLSHFAPNTQYQVFALGTDGGVRSPIGPFPVTTDSSGAGSFPLFSFVKRSDHSSSVSAFVGSVSSGPQPVAC
jgi:hypothetical protein